MIFLLTLPVALPALVQSLNGPILLSFVRLGLGGLDPAEDLGLQVSQSFVILPKLFGLILHQLAQILNGLSNPSINLFLKSFKIAGLTSNSTRSRP